MPGQGTVVRILLPASAPGAREISDDIQSSAGAAKSTGVLVVDDNKAVADSSRALLEQRGYQVWTAESADEALAMLAAGARRPAKAKFDAGVAGRDIGGAGEGGAGLSAAFQ